jgi:predicted RNase H-like HicB family nuclease
MTQKFTYWKDGKYWLGYLNIYPDYMSQGSSLQELKDNLKDIYNGLTSGDIPSVRKVGELKIA